MLWASTLPERFWGDAVLYTSYIRNRLPTRSNPDLQTPLENLTGKPPSVAHILKFGSKCTLHLANKKGKSLRKRAERAVVLGLSPVQKGYILYLSRTKKVTISASIQNIELLDAKNSAALIDAIDAVSNADLTETMAQNFLEPGRHHQ
ncbi:hypothetical protein PI125_g19746 [Phytophthora idaei]|nr:hypothetical protein PI125_g19746 [Phytophthora idaei]